MHMHSQLLRIKAANVISPKQFPRKTLKPSIHYLNVTRGQGQKSYFRGRIIKESFISFPGLCLTIRNERDVPVSERFRPSTDREREEGCREGGSDPQA